MLTSSRYQIQYPQLSDSPDVPRDFAQQVVQGVERSMMYGQGTFANRPVSTPGSPGIQGRIYYATDVAPPNMYYDFGTGWTIIFTSAVTSVPLVPIGGVLDWPWASAQIPTWALLAYGQSLPAGSYPAMQALAEATGIATYGGTTGVSCNLPDYRGRVGAGVDNMGGSLAPGGARMTAGISGINGTVLGAAGGVEGVVLTTAQIPAHNHTPATTDSQGYHGHGASSDYQGNHSHGGGTGVDSPDHAHGLPIPLSNQGFSTGGVYNNQILVSNQLVGLYNAVTQGANARHSHGISADGNHIHNISIAGDGYHTHNLTLTSSGGGTVHTNTQPTIVVNKLMRVL
jgi:microcystin-dependent protein